MYERALQGYEKALGPEHISALITVNNLGTLYMDQGKMREAREMYKRALQGLRNSIGLVGPGPKYRTVLLHRCWLSEVRFAPRDPFLSHS
jgi:tetratricopeptide (TPR) repeat protein